MSTRETLVAAVEVWPTEHPYVVRVPGIAGGEPIIKGTRVSVRAIAMHYKAGETPEEILDAYPHVPPAAVMDAISYYRLLIDEDVSRGPHLAAALRRRGFDAVAVQEIGKMGLSDEELLNYAAVEGRALLTFNVKDFVRYASAWYETGREHSGIIRVHRKLERGVRIMPLIMEKSVFVRVHPRSSASYFR